MSKNGKKRVKTYNRYSEELKRKIAKSYLAGEASYAVLAEEHGLRNRGVVKEFVRWYRRKLAAEPNLESQQMKEQRADFNEPLQQSEQELQGRIKALEQALRLSELKAELLETMIDEAEELFNLEIRKKSGTDQSKR